jgi:hypothetical protein
MSTKNEALGLMALLGALASISERAGEKWSEVPEERRQQYRDAITAGNLEPSDDCDCEFCSWIKDSPEWAALNVKRAQQAGDDFAASLAEANIPGVTIIRLEPTAEGIEKVAAAVSEAVGEADPYADLKAKHAAGASIFGIAKDGSIHYISEPKWECPPDRYVYMHKGEGVYDRYANEFARWGYREPEGGEAVRKTVPDILREAASQYEVKNPLYGDAYKAYGPTMLSFFPQGLFINEESDWVRFGLFSMMVSKMNRIAANLAIGGHYDSALDLAAYAAMMAEVTEQK